MRRIIVLTLIVAVVAGCDGGGDTTTTATTIAATAGETTTIASVATTGPSSTSTATTEVTTTADTTTTSIAAGPVTEHPNLPSAQGAHLVDWGAVGPDWALVLYDAMDVAAASPGPVVLYLVSPSGDRFEVAAWPDDGPYAILDWAGSADAALVQHNGGTAAIVDLRTGIETATIAVSAPSNDRPLTFTEPTGTNVVALVDDGTNQRVERRSRSGAVLATLGEQPTPVDARAGLDWLYGYDGTFALIKADGGIAYVENDGTFVRDVWTPMAHICRPVRWWDAGTFVAACTGDGPAFPHDFYHQVWLLETDGTAGVPLTTIPAGPLDVVDFGHTDAWEIPGRVFAQWWGDCGTAAVHLVAPDGSFTTAVGANSRYLEIDDGGMVIQRWAACDMSEGELLRVDLDGTVTATLVPRVGDAWGVRDAATLAAVYP